MLTVPRSFWQRGIVALRNILSTFRFPGEAALSSLEPLPHLHVFTFSVIPTQLGRTDPFCVLLHDPTLIFVVKAFGSVKHEGPYCRRAADWRDLPGVVHRGLHVVLPCVR